MSLVVRKLKQKDCQKSEVSLGLAAECDPVSKKEKKGKKLMFYKNGGMCCHVPAPEKQGRAEVRSTDSGG